MARRPTLALIVWLAAAVAAGCGDADAGSEGSAEAAGQGKPLQEFVRRADRICVEGRERVRRQLEPHVERLREQSPPSTDALMDLNARAAALARPLLADLEALPRPEQGRHEIETYLDANRRTLAAVDDAVRAHERGDDRGRASALQRNRELAAETVAAASEAGLRECGQEYAR